MVDCASGAFEILGENMGVHFMHAGGGRLRHVGRGVAVAGAVVALAATTTSYADAAALPKVTITTKATARALPTSTAYTGLEGGVTDGDYYYSVTLRHTKVGSKSYDSAQLIKTKMGATNPTLRKNYAAPSNHKKPGALGHGNDIAYNSDTKQLVIPAWSYDDSQNNSKQADRLNLVDPKTLKIVGTKAIGHTTTGICYDALNNRYVAGSLGKYYVYNSSFHQTSSSPKLSIPGRGQGIDCDEDYVYVVTSNKDSQKTDLISVYDWSFKHITTYQYASHSETEHLTHQRGTYYLGINYGGASNDGIYRLDGFQYTVRYSAGGGTGSMASTIVLYGRSTGLRKNTFTRSGYTFAGWSAKRSIDDKTRYQSPKDASKTGWYAAGHQPSGWKLCLYADGVKVLHSTTRGAVAMTATWHKK